jgi:hypothetical protein
MILSVCFNMMEQIREVLGDVMCSRRKIICSSLVVDMFHSFTIHTIMTPLKVTSLGVYA